ncbi:MAG TPA: HAMP domain-containing sensor histidine kinase [Kofleriaceae bacterium]|nr:HAMP domain-containing sensor histidine kinase [Kofleriaceae bacterium]
MTRALRSTHHTPPTSNRELDEILSVVSHDLRSPLSALSVAIDALAEPDMDAATRDRYLAAMRRSIQRAERFLNDLIDVSRMDAGSFAVDPEPVGVAALLEDVAKQHEAAAHEAGNWFVLEIADGVDRVRADRARVLQALDALVMNALRYARGTGVVTLRAELARGAVRLWVIDHGPGLPRGEVDQVFDRPWRRRDERRAGNGLGLVLARGIAEAHGGAARAVSASGQGAAFYLELPAQ